MASFETLVAVPREEARKLHKWMRKRDWKRHDELA
jgi:hypothetical protein